MPDIATSSKKYDQALKDQELDILEDILEADYVFHADGIALSVRLSYVQ